jgi:hypothetical protein
LASPTQRPGSGVNQSRRRSQGGGFEARVVEDFRFVGEVGIDLVELRNQSGELTEKLEGARFAEQFQARSLAPAREPLQQVNAAKEKEFFGML